MKGYFAVAAAVLLMSGTVSQTLADEAIKAASAELQDAEGRVVGTISLVQTDGAGVLLNVSINSLPPGSHAFHIHETGKCEGDFKSAGGHFNPEGHEHGMLTEGGPHAGDLPNIHIPASGTLNIEIVAPHVALPKDAENTLFDEDGSAFIVHAGVDDYKSQPSGDAGGRIACGVITNKIIDNQ